MNLRTASCVATVAAITSVLQVNANPGVLFNDATGDIDVGIATGGGTLDLVSMEVSHTATDIQFKLTVNGNIGIVDWGKFMVGIANNKGNGTSSSDGWSRPITMSANGGMTNWLGGWVDNGGGAENRSHEIFDRWGLTGATYNGNFGTYYGLVSGDRIGDRSTIIFLHTHSDSCSRRHCACWIGWFSGSSTQGLIHFGYHFHVTSNPGASNPRIGVILWRLVSHEYSWPISILS